MIGAGSSGIAAAKALHQRGFDFDCFEKSDRVGGNWVFKNRNGMSSAYRSLHINTSRERMEFADFPMPKSYPDFPHHTHIAAYFDAYVDHFGFRDRITFETGVERAAPAADGTWEVTLDDGRGAPLRRADRGQRPPLGRALAGAGVPRHATRSPGADPRARLHGRGSELLPRQAGRRARDGQLGDGHRGRVELLGGRHVPRGAARRLGRSPSTCSGGRSTRSPRRPACRSGSASGFMQTLLRIAVGDMRALRAAEARSRPARGAPDDLRRHPLAHGARRDHAEAEHRAAHRAHRRVRRRQRGGGRHRHLLHGLQGDVPVLRPGADLGARQRPAAVPARVPPRSRERLLHRRCCSRSGRPCRWPRRSREWVGDYLAGRYALPDPSGAAGRHRGRARADVQALRGLQAPHDAGRLRRLPGGAGEGAPARRRAGARAGLRLPVPPREAAHA